MRKRARASKGRTEATETRTRKSNSTIMECLVDTTSPTFYATSARFVNDGDFPEILLTVIPETEL